MVVDQANILALSASFGGGRINGGIVTDQTDVVAILFLRGSRRGAGFVAFSLRLCRLVLDLAKWSWTVLLAILAFGLVFNLTEGSGLLGFLVFLSLHAGQLIGLSIGLLDGLRVFLAKLSGFLANLLPVLIDGGDGSRGVAFLVLRGSNDRGGFFNGRVTGLILLHRQAVHDHHVLAVGVLARLGRIGGPRQIGNGFFHRRLRRRRFFAGLGGGVLAGQSQRSRLLSLRLLRSSFFGQRRTVLFEGRVSRNLPRVGGTRVASSCGTGIACTT